VTSVSQDEVSVRCGSGARLCVPVQHLLQGRSVLSADLESMQALQALQKAQAHAVTREEKARGS